jgi:hypothetical protein
VVRSHQVRIAVATCLAAAVPAVLGFQLFASHLGGETSRDVVVASSCHDDSCTVSPAVRRTVAVLEDEGLACRREPGLTDSIVFEWRTTEVSVVDFPTSLRAASNGEGWVRSYCMQPR